MVFGGTVSLSEKPEEKRDKREGVGGFVRSARAPHQVGEKARGTLREGDPLEGRIAGRKNPQPAHAS
jgi:hypothetical protein